MKMKRIACVCVVLLTVLALTPANAKQQERPKLVLEIVVDQLRGDMPAMVLDRCGSGGFRYLTEKGVWYKNAHHWCATGDRDVAIVNHGSPWRYDNFVPIVFAGSSVRPACVPIGGNGGHRPDVGGLFGD